VPALAAAQTWIPPVDLAATSELNPWEPGPEIAMSGAGGGVAIWTQFKGVRNVEAASMSLAGIWGPPVKWPSAYFQSEPEVAMNEAGEAVAVWEQASQSQETVTASVRTPPGEWGPPETLSPDGAFYTNLDVAVGPAGEAVAVWSDVPTYRSIGGYRIEGSFKPAGGHWEPSVTISKLSEPGINRDSYSPQVAIAPTGQIVAAWNSYDGDDGRWTIQVAEKQGSHWSAPQTVSGERDTSSPKLEASTAGATVIWQSEENEKKRIEAANRAGGGWTEPVELSGPESFGPQIGADGAGAVVAIWSSFHGQEGADVESSALPVGGHWSEPTSISGPVALDEYSGARLAVAPNGQTLAAWSVGRELEPQVGERFVEEASGLEGEWEEPRTLSRVGTGADRAAVALDGQGDGAVAWWAGVPSLPQATEFVMPRSDATSGGEPAPSNNQASRSKRRRATVSRVALVRKGKAYLELRCPGVSACKGSLRLVVPPIGKNGKATLVSTRSIDFAIPASHEKTFAVRLNRKGRQLLSSAGRKGVRIWLVGNQIQRSSLMLRRITDQ
jgi:hypothetical protein